jgi:hypothetical protein
MKREVFFLISQSGAILWSDSSNSSTALPDSRRRWQAIWHHRDELAEIAHSHPTGGASFSYEDETTMQALTTALGKAPIFSVIAPEAMIRREQDNDHVVQDEPWWVPLLRLASGMPITPTPHPLSAEE